MHKAQLPNTNTVTAHNALSEKYLTPEAGQPWDHPLRLQESSTIPGPLRPSRGPGLESWGKASLSDLPALPYLHTLPEAGSSTRQGQPDSVETESCKRSLGQDGVDLQQRPVSIPPPSRDLLVRAGFFPEPLHSLSLRVPACLGDRNGDTPAGQRPHFGSGVL